MTANRSMIDVAYDILVDKKQCIDFKALWEDVKKSLGYDDGLAKKKIVQFYNDIMLDRRFVALDDNKWDLRARRKFEEIHIDTSAIIIEDDEDDEEDIDDEDEIKEKNTDDDF